MWYILVVILLIIIAAFLLGVYLLARKIANKATDIQSEIIKETFSIYL